MEQYYGWIVAGVVFVLLSIRCIRKGMTIEELKRNNTELANNRDLWMEREKLKCRECSKLETDCRQLQWKLDQITIPAKPKPRRSRKKGAE